MAFRKRFTQRSGRVKKSITWDTQFLTIGLDELGAVQGTLTSVAVSPSVPTYFASAAQLTDVTVMRTRGALQGVLKTAGSSGTPGVLVMASGIATEQAVNAGPAGLPDPIIDAGWDGWFLYVTLAMFIDGTMAGADDATSFIDRIQYDSKAMRRVKSGDAIFTGFQYQALVSGSSTCQFMAQGRTLIKYI